MEMFFFTLEFVLDQKNTILFIVFFKTNPSSLQDIESNLSNHFFWHIGMKQSTDFVWCIYTHREEE